MSNFIAGITSQWSQRHSIVSVSFFFRRDVSSHSKFCAICSRRKMEVWKLCKTCALVPMLIEATPSTHSPATSTTSATPVLFPIPEDPEAPPISTPHTPHAHMTRRHSFSISRCQRQCRCTATLRFRRYVVSTRVGCFSGTNWR